MEPSRAPGRAGPAAWAAAAEQAAGWVGAQGQGRLAAGPWLGLEAARGAPPPVAAERTAVPAGGVW